jgi:murein DD-endopeptidase MepM/ murein hydrolase activator NlpD
MTNRNKEKKSRRFRLTFIDDNSHKLLVTLHFTKTSFFVAVISILVIICACTYTLIAYTPIKTFIPGYPDARAKRAAIQNAITIDSLESVIFRWELYSENLKRVLEGKEVIKIDSLIKAQHQAEKEIPDMGKIGKQDSLLREHVKEEEKFGISARGRRNLPIEGMHFFTPLKGVISQGYDPAIHPYIDLTAPEGSVVKATLDGSVIFAGWSDESGYTIQIQHDGDIVSTYKHNEKLLKKTGEKVTAGSPIALVGNTGSLSTGAHLHFELWYKGETVDPTKYINF